MTSTMTHTTDPTRPYGILPGAVVCSNTLAEAMMNARPWPSMTEREHAAVAHVWAFPRCFATGVSNATGCAPSTARATLLRLAERGIVARDSEGRWIA